MTAMRGVVVAVLLAGAAVAARAETPAQLCARARAGTDDTLRQIPAELVPAVNAAVGVAMPPQVAMRGTVYRCVAGHVAVCTMGANLPCGKANAAKTSAGATAWCKDNPEADVVPAFATGHDTIYAWRCRGGVAEPVRQVSDVDPRGFLARYWKTLP
jgi:hypothetical protein